MFSSDIWFFRRLGIQTRLPDSVLQELKKQGYVERWGHGAKIYHEQDDENLYVILGGQVFLEDGFSRGQTRLLRGDIFGKTATAAQEKTEIIQSAEEGRGGQHEPSQTRLIAFDETTLWAVSQEAFREITREHLGHFETPVGGLLGQKSLVRIPVLPLLCTSPAARIARVLLHLAETQGTIVKDTATFMTVLKPAQIGRLTGLDAGRVRVLLMHFLAEQLVIVKGQKVTIPSVEAIRALSVSSD